MNSRWRVKSERRKMNVSEQQSVVSWKMRFLQGLRVAKFQTGKEPYKEAELVLGTKKFPPNYTDNPEQTSTGPVFVLHQCSFQENMWHSACLNENVSQNPRKAMQRHPSFCLHGQYAHTSTVPTIREIEGSDLNLQPRAQLLQTMYDTKG